MNPVQLVQGKLEGMRGVSAKQGEGSSIKKGPCALEERRGRTRGKQMPVRDGKITTFFPLVGKILKLL